MLTSMTPTARKFAGSPITRSPSVGYHDLDLYQLHCFVADSGGPDIVTQNMKWRSICAQVYLFIHFS